MNRRIDLQGAPRGNSQGGFAIIIVLWVLMILSALTLTFVSSVTIDLKMVKFQQDTLRADQIAKAGLRQALILLREDALKDYDVDIDTTVVGFDDDDRYIYDGGSESWAYNPKLYDYVEFGGGNFTVQVRDEASKLPINQSSVSQDMIIALLTRVGVEDEDQAESIAGAIVDWRDGDPDPVEGGSERGMGSRDSELTFYNGDLSSRDLEGGSIPRFVPKNGSFSSRDELLMVWGITPAIFFGEDANENDKLDRNERDGRRTWPPDDGDRYLSKGLKNYITTYTGRCNINTASEEVLYALLYPTFGDDAENMAEDIAEYRNGSDKEQYTDDDRVMRTPDDSDGDDMNFDRAGNIDPKAIQELLQSTCTIFTNYFEVTVLSEYKDVQRGLYAVVRRDFIEEDFLPFFGEDTETPEDLDQVKLTVVEYETLEDAQDRYFGQSGKKRRRGNRRR